MVGEGEDIVLIAEFQLEILERLSHHGPQRPYVTPRGLVARRRGVEEGDDVLGCGGSVAGSLHDCRLELVPGDVRDKFVLGRQNLDGPGNRGNLEVVLEGVEAKPAQSSGKVKEGTDRPGWETKGLLHPLPDIRVELGRPGTIKDGGREEVGGLGQRKGVNCVHFLPVSQIAGENLVHCPQDVGSETVGRA